MDGFLGEDVFFSNSFNVIMAPDMDSYLVLNDFGAGSLWEFYGRFQSISGFCSLEHRRTVAPEIRMISLIDLFHATGLFLYPLRKPLFSGGMERY